MTAFDSVALLRAHQVQPAFMNYLISDLTELAGLASAVRDLVSDVAIPVSTVDRDPLGDFERFMKRRRPALVGISTFTCGVSSARQYAEIAKRHGAFVVLGGYHPSALPDEILSWPTVDAVVRGEGERTLRELIERGPSTSVLGLSFKDGESIVHNGERPLIDDLDALPLPLRELRPRRYGRAGDDYHVDSVYSSRGCHAKCTFCANHLIGKRWRDRSFANVVEELESIRPGRSGSAKLVKLWDPNFMTDVGRTAELCRAIIAAGLNKRFRFVAETRVGDILRGREILGLLAEAGFIRMGTGIESPNEETLRRVNKGGRMNVAGEAAALLKQHGINIEKFYIIGLPGEGEDEMLRYAEHAADGGAWKQNAHFFILTPYPGTVTYDELDREGRITSKDWNLYNNFMATFESDGIPRLRLQALQMAVVMRYALMKRFQRKLPFRKLATKFAVMLTAACKVVQYQDAFSRDEQIDCVWSALELVGSIGDRPPIERARVLDSLRIVVHRNGSTPLTLCQSRDGDREVLSLSEGARPGGLALHLSVEQMYELAGRIDARQASHHVITARLSPGSLGSGWLTGLGGLVGRLMATGVAIAGFNVRQAVARG